MTYYNSPALQRELEQELEEDDLLDLQFEEEMELMPIVAQQMAPTRCPADRPRTVRGFSRYSDDIGLLPTDQQNKLATISLEITRSLTGAPGVEPVIQVLVVGHADLDAARESREPGFLQFMSEKRALSASYDLQCRMDLSLVLRIRWIEIGRGARSLAVSAPRMEAERKCNRRVEIMLVRSPQLPPRLNDNQHQKASVEFDIFVKYYIIALQGTSGQYDKPQVAERKAREIAERVGPFLSRRNQRRHRCENNAGFLKRFDEVLQGTASKFPDPDVVINQASEIAEHALFGPGQVRRKLEWINASLPQPIGPDCEVDGKVPGAPVNHLFCRTHGHIVNTTTRMVIAHDLEEYKKVPT
jgi:hypothetical protein